MKPTNNIFGPPSLGNPHRDVKNLAVLLRNMDSGISTYHAVYNGLESKYGTEFKKLYLQEVRRG